MEMNKNAIHLYADHRISFERMILLLKSYDYSEIQITNFLIKGDDTYLFEDLMNEFDYIRDKNIIGFRKVSCNIKALHDEAIKCTKAYRKEEIYDTIFVYNDFQRESSTSVKNYNIKLPANGQELFEWADLLQNCMAAYSYFIQYGMTTIYGFFKNEILIFAVEVKDGKLIEASGKNNRLLNIEEQHILDAWVNKFFPRKQTIKEIYLIQ